MDGNTHFMIGIIFAEILYVTVVSKYLKKDQAIYSRALMWFLGGLGGWSPDGDGLSGVFENVLTQARPWSIDLFYEYHRAYSHGIVALAVTIAMVIVGIVCFNASKEGHEESTESRLARKKVLPIYGMLAMLAGFLFYSDATKYYAFFFLLGAMVFFTWTLVTAGTPLYAVAFFGAALFHHLCDFIQCKWNPFAPWDPNVMVGLFLYCNGYNNVFYYILEIPPHIVVLILLFIRINQYVKNKRVTSENVIDKDMDIEAEIIEDGDEKI
jgi:hypothetical protein